MKSLTDKYEVCSRAVSFEEIGNDIYTPMKMELKRRGIKFDPHSASRITHSNYDSADYIFYMDESNKAYLDKMFADLKGKIKPIYYYSKDITEIEDPWYTGNYKKVCDLIEQCCKDILKNI